MVSAASEPIRTLTTTCAIAGGGPAGMMLGLLLATALSRRVRDFVAVGAAGGLDDDGGVRGPHHGDQHGGVDLPGADEIGLRRRVRIFS